MELPDEEEINAAQLAVAGLALTRAGLRDAGTAPSVEPSVEPTVAPSVGPSDAASTVASSSEPQQTPYPTPTPRTANAPGVSEGPDATVAAQSGRDARSAGLAGRDRRPRMPNRARRRSPPWPRLRPTPEAEAPVEAAPSPPKTPGEFTVYHTENGRYYHTSCHLLRHAAARRSTRSLPPWRTALRPVPSATPPPPICSRRRTPFGWMRIPSITSATQCSAFAGEKRA